MLDDEVIKLFDEKRVALNCKVNKDGSAEISNSGDPFKVTDGEDGDSVKFEKDIKARIRLDKNGGVILDKIRGVDPSGLNPGKVRIIDNRVCVYVPFTKSCP